MDDLGAVLRSVVFTPVRFRRSYAMDGVDALLDQAAAAADAGQDLTPLVQQAQLATTVIGEGYEIAEVDDFLSLVARRSRG